MVGYGGVAEQVAGAGAAFVVGGIEQGTRAAAQIGSIASRCALLVGPSTADTPESTAARVRVTARSRSVPSSCTSRLIGRPWRTPPSALISAAAIRAPWSPCWPNRASAPVSGSTTAIRTGVGGT